jgi:hypothetical protein
MQRKMGGYVGRWVVIKGDWWLCREMGGYVRKMGVI